MSLQYIIDAFNLINNPAFKPVTKTTANIQSSLVNFINLNRLAGSKNNSVILVFDGYPPKDQSLPEEQGLSCLFSQAVEADELIKRIVEKSAQPKNIIVVSDDKQVQLMSRLLHARICSVEGFINGKKNNKFVAAKKSDADDFKLTYSKMQKIDAEMKKRWLG